MRDDQGEWNAASQGRAICQQYIIQRSLKAGAQIKKLRTIFIGCDGQVTDHLTERLLEIVRTMESLNPSVFDSCSSKLKITLSSDELVRWVYESITSQLIKTGITWGKLISMFTVCGALASDCVSQGHTAFLPTILDCFEESCYCQTVDQFLKEVGGWSGVVDHYYEKLHKSSLVDLPEVPNRIIRLAAEYIQGFPSKCKPSDFVIAILFTVLSTLLAFACYRIFKVH